VVGRVDLSLVGEVFETNVFGVIAVTEAMLPLLHASRHGRIVNLSSSVRSLTRLSEPEHYCGATRPHATESGAAGTQVLRCAT